MRGLVTLNTAKALCMAAMLGGIGGAAFYNRAHIDGRADHVDAKVAHAERAAAKAERASDVALDAATVTLSSGPLATEKTLQAKVARLYSGMLWQQKEIDALRRELDALKREREKQR